MRYEIQYSCFSHIGNIRNTNQDNYICNGVYMEALHPSMEAPLNGTVDSTAPTVFGVLDGMGGEECGEVASYIAAKEALTIDFEKDSITALDEYCRWANARICEYTDNNGITAMGTTAAMLLFSQKDITLCNIGDSRIFRFAEGALEQISKDHVAISAFGTKPPLSQNLGIPEDQLLIEPYIVKGKYNDGDKYLICSDGLTDMVQFDEIAQIVSMPTNEAVPCLIRRALENGGKDNVTVIVLEVKRAKSKLFNIFNVFKKNRGGEGV